MTTTDAVVIGSGPNGLVAANLLADAGWSVVVLEEQDRPGGAVWSDDSVAAGARARHLQFLLPPGRSLADHPWAPSRGARARVGSRPVRARGTLFGRRPVGACSTGTGAATA